MHGAHAFLAALATVLGVAGATTILFQRLGQPVVLGYLIAGLIIGPHVPIPLVADPEIVETLSELGVILLMFSVGLELRIRTLLRMAPTAGVTAVVQCSLMVWLGFLTGRLFGWTSRRVGGRSSSGIGVRSSGVAIMERDVVVEVSEVGPAEWQSRQHPRGRCLARRRRAAICRLLGGPDGRDRLSARRWSRQRAGIGHGRGSVRDAFRAAGARGLTGASTAWCAVAPFT
jgi:hypothetical protein